MRGRPLTSSGPNSQIWLDHQSPGCYGVDGPGRFYIHIEVQPRSPHPHPLGVAGNQFDHAGAACGVGDSDAGTHGLLKDDGVRARRRLGREPNASAREIPL